VKRRPRKILHILPSLNETYGGPLRLVLELSARAEGPDLSSHIAGIGALVAKDNPMDVSRIHELPAGRGGAYTYSSQLRPWLRGHLPDYDGAVIHGAWTYPGWAAATECRRVSVPYAYYPHGMLELWAVRGQGHAKAAKKMMYWLSHERFVCRHARCTFFTTEREKERTQQVFRIASPQGLLRPYGLEIRTDRVPEPADRSLFQPPDCRVALFLGRLHPKKNMEFLLEAWRAAAVPAPWRLVIAGSGDADYDARLRRLANSFSRPGDIHFTGFVSGLDKRYLLQRAEWFLLPSHQENFGIAVLEAVEQGCAVAISEQVYLAESFRPESEVLPLRAEAWAEFFRTRMQDLNWRHRVAADDRAHLLETFQMDRIVERWTETFRDLF
jgi:glycosyltransferase involved in cell wall biosynthesis